MSDLSQESPLWREWAESRHSVQQMRDELDRLRAGNADLVEALKAFVSYDELADSGCCDVATMMAYAEAIEKARAALAKAGAK